MFKVNRFTCAKSTAIVALLLSSCLASAASKNMGLPDASATNPTLTDTYFQHEQADRAAGYAEHQKFAEASAIQNSETLGRSSVAIGKDGKPLIQWVVADQRDDDITQDSIYVKLQNGKVCSTQRQARTGIFAAFNCL